MKFIQALSRKQIFELSFSFIVAILFIIKLFNPNTTEQAKKSTQDSTRQEKISAADTTLSTGKGNTTVPHKIYSVSDYDLAFPDVNDVQLVAAKKLGIKPQADHNGVLSLSGKKLVNIQHSPYYSVAELSSSLPYLVPKAQFLLQKIGRNFIDSLLIKGMPPALIVVTSVTRSQADISDLQTSNVNAVESSCHSYGTTVDISYSKYKPFTTLQGKPMHLVRDDSLKWVLAEVLNDLRLSGECYVKHERKQGCFHLTVR